MNNIQNRVPVIDEAHRPLAPCSPRRARILVQQGKAHGRHRNGVYYLTLYRTVPLFRIYSNLTSVLHSARQMKSRVH